MRGTPETRLGLQHKEQICGKNPSGKSQEVRAAPERHVDAPMMGNTLNMISLSVH